MNSATFATHELDSPPWLRVESTLMSTARLIRVAYDARLEALQLNLTQASLIAYVAEFGSTTQTRLADHLGIGRAAIGSVVTQLQERGFVERQPDAADRRVWLVAITGSGEQLTTQIRKVDEILRAELRRDISRAERQTLAAVMSKVEHNARAAITEP